MNFPTSVLCNEAGQGVLKQKVRNAVNSLNRDWNFCSYSYEGRVFNFYFFSRENRRDTHVIVITSIISRHSRMQGS